MNYWRVCDMTTEDIQAPLYVDARAVERSTAIIKEVVRSGLLKDDWHSYYKELLEEQPPGQEDYKGNGTITAPFLTVDDARKVQKPGQSIVVTGYATIGAAKV
jgi:hypothetical protein